MKRKITIFIFTIILIFLSLSPLKLKAKEYLSDKKETLYDVNSGLLTGKANAICQTDDGYIWIGQYAGLTRYDSKDFVTITEIDDYDLTGIINLRAVGNTLFIGSEKGFFIKNGNDEIEKIELSAEVQVVKDIEIFNNTALIATPAGLYQYDIESQELTIINELNVTEIAVYNDSIYYYLVDKNIIYSNLYGMPLNEEFSVKTMTVSGNKLYLGTRTSSVVIFNIKEDGSLDNNYLYIQPSGLTGSINDILIKDDIIYISADDGLFIGETSNILEAQIVNSSISNYTSMEMAMFDYEGNLWLASSALGVFKITQSQMSDYFFEHGLDSAVTYAMEKYHGYTFIGTGTGLNVIDPDGNKINADDYVDDDTYSNEIRSIILFMNIIRDNPVRDLEIYNDKLYLATTGTYGYLYYYDYNEAETIYDASGYLKYDIMSKDTYDADDDSTKDFRILRACGDYLFIGLDRGIARYNESDSSYEYIDTSYAPLYMTYNGDDLYVVLNTIGVLKTSVSSFTELTRLDENRTYSTLKCLYTNNGILFTDNNKLYFIDDSGIKYIDLDIVGSVVDIAYINNEYIIASEAKIYIVKDLFAENILYEYIDQTAGLKSSLVANSTGYYEEDTNCYYFATSSGILVYDLDSDPAITIARKIALDAIYVDDVLVDNNSTINLKSANNKITICFSVLSYVQNQNYNVYYRLKGYDENWQVITSDSEFEITYKNLEGGSYSFELYTEEFDGTKSEESIAFNIEKNKKITEYEIFWIIIAVLIASAIIGVIMIIYTYRIRASIKRQNEYKKITLESIEAIARTIDSKDAYTKGHSIRVGLYSREIARELKLSDDEVQNIYYIALLHDIGKIAIPNEILNKPGRLTDEEFDIMKSHTTAGGKIIGSISTIPHIYDGVVYHHEKYGGGGYPKGLKGEEIPFVARIICCADCYDAMATKRVYKEPYSKEKIISEFERCKNIQFDPAIADVMIRIIQEGKLDGLDENSIDND